MSDGATSQAEGSLSSFVLVDGSVPAAVGSDDADLPSLMISDLGKMMMLNPLDSDKPTAIPTDEEFHGLPRDEACDEAGSDPEDIEFQDAEDTSQKQQDYDEERVHGADTTDQEVSEKEESAPEQIGLELQKDETNADQTETELHETSQDSGKTEAMPHETSQDADKTEAVPHETSHDTDNIEAVPHETSQSDKTEAGSHETPQDADTTWSMMHETSQDAEMNKPAQYETSQDADKTEPALHEMSHDADMTEQVLHETSQGANKTDPELYETSQEGDETRPELQAKGQDADMTGPEAQDDIPEDIPDATGDTVHEKLAETLMMELKSEQPPVVDVSESIAPEQASIAKESMPPGAQEQSDADAAAAEAQEQSEPDAAAAEADEEFMDVLGNGQLLKKILTHGKGQETRPKTDCRVTIDYEARLVTGQLVDSAEGLTITIGDCEVVQALDIALMLTALDERCQIVSGPQFAYGSKQAHGLIPPGSTLVYMVHLTRVDEPVDISTLSVDQRLTVADAKRERGNFWFNREDFYAAVCCYARSAALLERHCSEDASGVSNAALQAGLDARVRVYNNLAASQLKLEAWDSVVESCDKALRLQPGNAKAVFRKGRALSARGDHDAALRVLRAALADDPESRPLQNEVARVTLESRRQQTASQDLYRRMMGVKSPGSTRASASSSPQSVGSSSAAAAANSPSTPSSTPSLFARHKLWFIGAVGSLLVSAILAGAAYRHSR